MRQMKDCLLIALLAVAAFPAVPKTARAAEPRLNYSETRRVDHVDEYHGTKVADPYRWLEDDVRESKEVAAWVEAKNKETFAYLE